MKISIHRGINQIGGCITEIASDTTRILIDLGQNLPDGNGNVNDELANQDAISKLTKGIDAILYTHYHGDHIGLFHFVPDDIPQYIGEVAKKVIMCKHKRLSFIKGREELSKQEINKIENMLTYTPNQVLKVGDIEVTPYFVSHSAYDAYMFLIEVDGKRVLHTGDFRDHSYLGKGLIPTIKNHILNRGSVDYLITEGTMLSRLNEKVKHENDLKKDLISIMKQYQNVFVMCSSTDMERLATVHAASRVFKDRPFVCDDFQKDVLQIFSESAGTRSSLFDFGKPYTFSKGNSKLINWMKDKGFCMLTRATDKFSGYLNEMLPQIDLNETVLVYSMWKEYINPHSKHANERYLSLAGRFTNVKHLHASGHASADCLAEVCNLVNPTRGIIPIHSEKSHVFAELALEDDLKAKIVTESAIIKGVR